jgi:AcrR family transcriptional regulator
MTAMARWEPDARGRLEKAAMELFQEHGYVETTVEDIAARACLMERAFFRYLADKREVLFSGSKELEKSIVDGIEGAPEEASPLDAVASAFEAAATMLQDRRDLVFVRARYALVTKHTDIQERELIKMASLAVAVTKALHRRGVSEPSASVAAEAGIAVFRIGFERWVTEKKPRDFAAHIRAAVDALKAVAGGKAPTARSSGKKKPRRRASRPRTRGASGS